MEGAMYKRAGALLFVGAGQFILFLTIAEALYPGYSVSTNPISDLGATCKGGACRYVQPSSSIFDLSVAALGIFLIGAAYFAYRGSGSRSFMFFVALAGVGAIGVGTFNESYGQVHVFVSALTFLAGGIQAILAYKVARAPYSLLAASLGVITLVALVLYATNTYAGLGQGGMERLVAYPALINGVATGGYLMGRADTRTT
jgi:hypothetical membrane protein